MAGALLCCSPLLSTISGAASYQVKYFLNDQMFQA